MIEYDPFSPDVKECPETYFKELRRTCPVHRHVMANTDVNRINSNPLVARQTSEFYSVSRYDDIRLAACDPVTFSSSEGPVPERIMPLTDDGMLLYADPPAHTRQRRILGKALSPGAMEQLRPYVQEIADDLIDDLGPKGGAELLSEFTVPLSIRVMADVVGVDHDRVGDLYRWGRETMRAFGGDAEAIEQSFIAMQELFAYLMPKITLRREMIARGEDLPPGILSALVAADYEGSTFSDTEVLMAAQTLLLAGFETTSTGAASGIYLLCLHPEQRRLYEDGQVRIENVVEEILRFAPPLMGLFRNTTRNVEISGCPIPAGAKVQLLWVSANFDENVFGDPDVFRVDRGLAESRKHMAFGFGPHACPGAALARIELAVTISTLFRRLPGLHLDPSQEPERNPELLVNGFRRVPIRWDPALVRPRPWGATPMKGP